MISGRDDADEQRGAAAVHQPHHLVAAEAAVGAEEELAAGAEPERADRRAFGVDDFALFAVDVDLLQRVGLVGPGVGDVVRPERRGEDEERRSATKSPRKARATRLRRSRRRRGARDCCPLGLDRRWARRRHAPSVKPAPGGYLNWKLVRSSSKVGLQITLSRSIALETKVDSVRVPYGSPGRLFHEFLVELRVFGFLLGPELLLRRAWRSSRSAPGSSIWEKLVLLVGTMLSPVSSGWKKSFGCG